MKDRCILWGAGKIGQSIISTINTIYEIYAFCDNEKLKWGGVIGNIPIISPDELKQLCYEDKIDCIIISVKKEEHINQIRKALLGILPEKIDVLDGIEFINGQQNDYLIKVRNTLQYHWA